MGQKVPKNEFFTQKIKKITFFGSYSKNLNILRKFEKSAPRELCLDDFCAILALFTKKLVS